jgi:hypothetical protein
MAIKREVVETRKTKKGALNWIARYLDIVPGPDEWADSTHWNGSEMLPIRIKFTAERQPAGNTWDIVRYVDDLQDEAPSDDTPFGRGGDWCAWCGADWKAPHERGCPRPDGES